MLAQAILLISCAVYLAAVLESPSLDTQLLLVGLLIVGLMVLVWVIFGFWAGWRSALKVGGLFYAVVLLLMTVRSTWQLSFQTGLMRPAGFWRATTDPDVRRLVRDVQRDQQPAPGRPHGGRGAGRDPGQAGSRARLVSARPADAAVGGGARRRRTGSGGPEPSTARWPARQSSLRGPAQCWATRPFGRYVGSEYAREVLWTPDMLPALPAMDPGVDSGLPVDELDRLRSQRLWGDTLRPRLEWLVYRTVSQPPPVARVGLWALAE